MSLNIHSFIHALMVNLKHTGGANFLVDIYTGGLMSQATFLLGGICPSHHYPWGGGGGGLMS